MNLPKELQPYQAQIEKSALEYVQIQLVESETNLELTQSKVGGLPYLPHEIAYPRDTENEPMLLLAQLNFAEIPHLQHFPKSGILQFYIAMDDVCGIDFDNLTTQTNFRVLFHPTIDLSNCQNDFSFLEGIQNEDFYLLEQNEYALQFKKSIDYVSAQTIDFETFFGADAWDFFTQLGEKRDEIHELYWETFQSEGHKIGGYPFFTQGDPRERQKQYKAYNILLFQLDSDGDRVLWGDSGVGNFFISLEDLQNLNFDNILYTWDCC